MCANVSIYAGARTDIESIKGVTALQKAGEKLSEESDPEKKQRYEKVHEDTHTITNFGMGNGCRKESCIFLVFAFQKRNFQVWKCYCSLYAIAV